MTGTLIPERVHYCPARVTRKGHGNSHEPGQNTVESDQGVIVESQFGTCMHCAQRIARFRPLGTGRWFDAWGNLADSAYVVPTDWQ
jgi:hypothetical protein